MKRTVEGDREIGYTFDVLGRKLLPHLNSALWAGYGGPLNVSTSSESAILKML